MAYRIPPGPCLAPEGPCCGASGAGGEDENSSPQASTGPGVAADAGLAPGEVAVALVTMAENPGNQRKRQAEQGDGRQEPVGSVPKRELLLPLKPARVRCASHASPAR